MRILMLGNSLTTANDLPVLLGNMLDAEVVVHARGGARLAEHLNPDTRLGAMTQHAFAEHEWDFVILQEASDGPVMHRARFLDAAAQLCVQIHAVGATPVLFTTWAYAPDCPKLPKKGVTHDEMHQLLTAAYHEAATAADALVADVGAAFYEASDKHELYRPDGVHPSEKGTQLAAHTIAHTIQNALPTWPGTSAHAIKSTMAS